MVNRRKMRKFFLANRLKSDFCEIFSPENIPPVPETYLPVLPFYCWKC